MEFIIVAPLYFLLLGGLFMVGDLILNRTRMHIGDHLATWVGASRFCPRDVNTGYKDKDAVDGLVEHLFDRAIGGVVPHDQKDGIYSDWFDVMEDGSEAKINNFIGLYFGGILKLPVKIPSWVRGMMGIQGEMVNGSREIFLMDTANFNCGYFRSLSFHRFPLTGIDNGKRPADSGQNAELSSRAKCISAADVANRGYLQNVMSETWISLGGGDSPKELSPKADFPKGRNLGLYGE